MLGKRVFIGIDDTDNLHSRGTGYRVRTLGELLEKHGYCTVESVTRHQLLVSPEIPYTSHNSSACLTVRATQDDLSELIDFCRRYLLHESAPGSDAGLCVMPESGITLGILTWGFLAKQQVLNQQLCRTESANSCVFLHGLTGDHGGIIGALAAVGLRAGGNDGRFIGLRGVREVEPGEYTVAELFEQTAIDRVQSLAGAVLSPREIVSIGEWLRPVLLDGLAVLLVENTKNEINERWVMAGKPTVKLH